MKESLFTVTVVTAFPEIFTTWAVSSLVGRAQKAGLIKIDFVRFADMVPAKERIDTPACGPGAGMVLKAPVVASAIEEAFARSGHGPVIFFSPTGKLLTQEVAQEFAHSLFDRAPEVDGRKESASVSHLVLVCGRYEGVDNRVIEHYKGIELSIGNYVLMGGDLPAQVFLEVLLRYVPGVIGDARSVERDSFTGALVDFPAYGLPVEWQGREVPPVLLSGNHAAIEKWRHAEALKRSVLSHFSWLRRSALPEKVRTTEVTSVTPAHYVVLMHDEVLIGRQEAKPGTTSVTTIDIHDIARSSATYGIKAFYVVTPLRDQQELLRVFFEFWHTERGRDYNENRYDAMRCVKVVSSLAEVEADVAARHEGLLPVKVATSARSVSGVRSVTYEQQEMVWAVARPVLLLFGTGQGMTEELLQRCDYVLTPVHGFTAYNHLSVRAAVAIILDRWIGYHEPVRLS